jgi:hypothetical protein
MMGESNQVHFEIMETYKNLMRRFAETFVKDWKLTSGEEVGKSDDYADGYNAGVDSVNMALDVFFEEDLYGR